MGIFRILMTTDCVGGVWTYSLELARALGPHGIEVALASMGRRLTQDQRKEAAAIPNLDLFESTYKLEWMEEPWEEVNEAGNWLLDLEEEIRPDLIHLNGYCHGSLRWRSPVVMVGHSCVFSWFRAVRECDPPPEWERYRREVSMGLRAARAVTAPTGAMLHCLREWYGPFAAADPIYNGRKGMDFAPRLKSPIILSVGRIWDEAKNTAALDHIAGQLSWPVYVAGESVHPENGGKSRLKNVIALGQLCPEEMARWFGRASIYVLPARYEPFGLSALEAALAGCTLVLGDIPSLREVWGDAAFYVPPDDPDLLSATLRTLISQEGLRDALARKAGAWARHYTPERMAAGYLRLYRSVFRAPLARIGVAEVDDSGPAWTRESPSLI